MIYAIAPVQILKGQATQLNIYSVTVQLDSSATIQWSLLDASNVGLANGAMTLTGTDYAAWGTDDAYILNQVAAQLGVTLAV